MIKQMTQKISKKAVLITAAVTAAILIIAVIVLCVCMFVRADKYYAEARLLDRAVIESTSIAETLKASHGDLTKASQLMTSHSQIDITENTQALPEPQKILFLGEKYLIVIGKREAVLGGKQTFGEYVQEGDYGKRRQQNGGKGGEISGAFTHPCMPPSA